MGANLIKQLITSSGLPEALAQDELSKILARAGKSNDQVTLEELREILAEYLQEVLLSAQKNFSGE